MTKPLEIDEEARAELLAECDWYEKREPGVGAALAAAFTQAVARIASAPEAWSPVPRAPRDLGLRLEIRNGGCLVSTRSALGHSLFARVEVAERGQHLGEGILLFTRDQSGAWVSGGPPPLSSGHHVLAYRFTPDARLAFDNDASATEIIGEAFEREVVVDVP